MNKYLVGLLYLLPVILLTSCSGNIYNEERKIAEGIWEYNDSLRFDFEIPDTAQLYTMELDVKHRDEFPYENCYVRIKSLYPDKTLKDDRLSLEFADETGMWMGEKSGGSWLAPIAIQPVAKFRQPGKYSMIFFQDTRQDSLPGIESLRLKIARYKAK
ncbi:MAG TPA: gliding motility lipoprotein GldH [Saprospiraceae bacterium]|jgi:gliding motility-associated lipoprotein GldH|nr:MAG: gliding motility protein GldH [Candidatus Parvibacillus calidus]MBX2938114.1 gliding motility lipoprotein GldH [Saprospiraceae bacterium]MBK7740682.1 gliding motility lipoprotein GldH [Candidatus Parvibacillus calidus]MBX7179851.1 gliding motility lipoprotein GldH [Saprospiraceae bacterium]MCB0590843.1 gliding motility lipoprotein GldH [Saprospiraceae bacterium]